MRFVSGPRARRSIIVTAGLVVALSASGCALPYVSAPMVEPEGQRVVGYLDVSPSGSEWVVEPFDDECDALRQYVGGAVIRTVPCALPSVSARGGFSWDEPEVLVRAMRDDRVFFTADAYAAELTMWNGTELVVLDTADSARAAFPPVALADGAYVVGIGHELRHIAADGTQRTLASLATSSIIDVVAAGDELHVLVNAFAGDREVLAVQLDGTTSSLGRVPEGRYPTRLARLHDQTLVVDSNAHVVRLSDLAGDEIAHLVQQARLLDVARASDGALYVLAADVYERFLVARIDDDGVTYPAAIERDRTFTYPEVTHLVPDDEGGVFVYGAHRYHVTRGE